VLLWVARYLSNRNTDNSTEKQLDRAEKLNEQTGLEAYRIREAATECQKSTDVIRERQSEARKSVEQAQSGIRKARQDNRTAEAIIEESFAIIETAEKEK
jgi:hypothetical protein